ncbi:MAG: retroviral-like aspartic protease family protein [Proteobacteria bacterium]|nr:retroviral-like aspartic protease family protein [Pseudomonadota bacterium]
MNNLFLSLLWLVLFLSLASDTRSEFYEYVDENGVKTFTDNPGIIPESKIEGIQVHKEPYDDLPEEERQEKIKADQAILKELMEKREAERQRYDRIRRTREFSEEVSNRKKKLANSKTPVVIRNNQILVPVTIGYQNKTVQSTLLLDTGATITVIHDNVAGQLGINSGNDDDGYERNADGKIAYAQVAGGGLVRTQNLEVKFIKVGPKILQQHSICVMTYKGSSASMQGLLGLDFLKHFKYDIDYKNSFIIWKE